MSEPRFFLELGRARPTAASAVVRSPRRSAPAVPLCAANHFSSIPPACALCAAIPALAGRRHPRDQHLHLHRHVDGVYQTRIIIKLYN